MEEIRTYKTWVSSCLFGHFKMYYINSKTKLFSTDDNIDETYGVNVQFESDEEVSIIDLLLLFMLTLIDFLFLVI